MTILLEGGDTICFNKYLIKSIEIERIVEKLCLLISYMMNILKTKLVNKQEHTGEG